MHTFYFRYIISENCAIYENVQKIRYSQRGRIWQYNMTDHLVVILTL
jgi:hypothetical protein